MTARGTNRRLIVQVQQRGGTDRGARIERHVRQVLAQLEPTGRYTATVPLMWGCGSYPVSVKSSNW